MEEGTTICQLLQKFKIPESLPMITLVNGIHQNFEYIVNPGDVLSVFPPVAGG
ncbi:MAG: MoaD/ThiS family protein [Deltaproteobacteria bacterium]|nr:MoaD/ThiS family protein [Deltaproteobacteria bacterium]